MPDQVARPRAVQPDHDTIRILSAAYDVMCGAKPATALTVDEWERAERMVEAIPIESSVDP